MSTIAVNTITDASGGNTAQINGATPTAYNTMGRNIVINGAMQISQRGTSESGIASGGSYRQAPDRFRFGVDTAGTWTVSQDTNGPPGFKSSYKMACTTANGSLSAGSYIELLQSFEGNSVQQIKKGTADAQPVTLSFWCKSNKTGTYIVNLQDTDNAQTTSQSYTINAADTWEYKTVTFVAGTSGSFDNDTNGSLRVKWWFAAGSNYTSGTLRTTSWESNLAADYAPGQTVNLADSTSNYFQITGVQLEVGSVATEFERRPYGTELALCQRYYEVVSIPGNQVHAVYFDGSTVYSAYGGFQVTKRASPTGTITTDTKQFCNYGGGGVVNATTVSVATSTTSFRYIYSGSSLSTGPIMNMSGTTVRLSAEL